MLQFGDILTFTSYYEYESTGGEISYFFFKFLTSSVYIIIMVVSMYRQRDSLRSSAVSSADGGLQSPIVNTILIMAGLTYFGVVASVTIFYGPSDLILPAIGASVYLVGSILLASHLVGIHPAS